MQAFPHLVTIEWYEYLVWLFYVFLGAFFLYFYKSYSETGNKYLMHGYFLKMFGGLFFALVYVYFYKGGDTIDYYLATKDLNYVFSESPYLFFRILLSDTVEAQKLAVNSGFSLVNIQWTSESFIMAKISSPFNLLGFNSYLVMTFFFSLISYFGTIKLNYVFNKLLPNHEFINFSIAFFTPSVLIWGSGILKDTFTLVSFSVLCFLFYKAYIKEIKFTSFIFKALIPSLVILNLKPYILACMIPFLFITIFFQFIQKSKHPILKFMILPYLIILFSIGLYYSTSLVLDSTEDYKREELFTTIKGFKSWHSTLGGSSYDLGEMEYTEFGMLSKLPEAVNVTLFRPYIWECKTLLSLFAGLESFFFFALTLYILIKHKFKFFSKLYESPFLLGLLLFVIIFAFILGVTVYNFGALVRFKIPLLSPYLFLLYYANSMINKDKLEFLESSIKYEKNERVLKW